MWNDRMKKENRGKTERDYFTLIELLVVISIKQYLLRFCCRL